MVISVAKILELAIYRASQVRGSLSMHSCSQDSFKRAYKLIKDTVLGSSKAPIAAIQGPPGTGKTTLVIESLNAILEEDSDYDLIVYVAPINNLVAEAATRALEKIIRKHGIIRSSKDLTDILDRIRILGSQIHSFTNYEEEVCKLSRELGVGKELLEQCLHRVTSRGITVSKSKPGLPYIVFTTEWINLTVLLESKRDLRVAVFFDEASRSPLHRVFTPLASILHKFAHSGDVDAKSVENKLEREYNIKSLVIIGDPEQTISSKEYRELSIYTNGRRSRFSWLALELAIMLLNKMKVRNEQFVMLDITLRIPEFGEKPISEGFYQGKLKAAINIDQRLSKSQLRILYSYIDNISDKIKQCDGKISRVIDSITDLLKDSLNPVRPVPASVIQTGHYKPSQEVEVVRSVIGALMALILCCALSEVISSKVTIGVISPYVAQVNFTKSVFDYVTKRIGVHLRSEVLRKVSVEFRTVHSVLGCEYDFVIAMLGKEYPYVEHNKYPTIYCSQPEVLNVQLSRQRIQLYVIGNVFALTDRFYSCITCSRSRRANDEAKVYNTAKTLLYYTTRGVYRFLQMF